MVPRACCLALNAPFQAIPSTAQAEDIQNYAVWRRAAWRWLQKAIFWSVKGCHVDKEESNLLWAAPIPVGVQAETRQQTVGPDSPVILANEGLFSDVKWSLGLQVEFGNGKAQFQLKGETNEAAGGSVRQLCLCGQDRLQPRGPGTLTGPISLGRWPLKLVAGVASLVSLATLSHQQVSCRWFKGFYKYPTAFPETFICSYPLKRALILGEPRFKK